MYVSHTVEIKPNSIMKKYLNQCFGYSRYIWNKALAEWIKQYEADLKPNYVSIGQYIRNTMSSWELSMPGFIRDSALNNLKIAFLRMFNKSIQDINIRRRPKFKTKRKCNSFVINCVKNDHVIKFNNMKMIITMGRECIIPKVFRWLTLTELPRFDGIIKQATIFMHSGKYYCRFCIDTSWNPNKTEAIETIGVDLGVKTFITLSNGQKFQYDKTKLKRLEQSAKFYQKVMDRKYKRGQQQSNKYYKTKTKFNNVWKRIVSIRKDFLHKLTTHLVRHYKTIVIEDLQVGNMIKNHKLAKSIVDMSFYTFREFLTYKSEWYGNTLIVANKTFPSTQTCSHCGNVLKGFDKLTLKDRIYHCKECGFIEDRDVNAAMNLKNYGSVLVGLQPVNNLGDEG